jgi:hypothetical protein
MGFISIHMLHWTGQYDENKYIVTWIIPDKINII